MATPVKRRPATSSDTASLARFPGSAGGGGTGAGGGTSSYKNAGGGGYGAGGRPDLDDEIPFAPEVR
jgi:hypothetical protein